MMAKQWNGDNGKREAVRWIESGVRIRESRKCACGAPCGEDRRCRRCQLEIDEINAIYDRIDEREEVGRERVTVFVVRMRLGRWLDYATIVVLAGAVFEIGMRVVGMTWAWIGAGGWNQ